MHFVHLFLLIFKAKGKGKYVLPILIASFIIAYFVYEGFGGLKDMKSNPMVSRLFFIVAFFLAGACASMLHRVHVMAAHAEVPMQEEIVETEDTYIYMKVSTWTKIFFVFGAINVVGLLGDYYGVFH